MPPDNIADLGASRWKLGLNFRLTEKGTWNQSSLHNAMLFLENHPHLVGMFVYDEFDDQIYVTRALNGMDKSPYPRALQDHDETALAAWLNENGLAPSITMTGAAIRRVAFKLARNPPMEWARTLKWDRKPRIDTWLSYYAGAKDDAYARIVGRRFLISAMARLINPGCQADTMLILEGAQGIRKSSLASVLASAPWFSDQVGDITSKDASQLIQGIWIMEIAEMDKFTRAEANTVKAFITRRFDRYRPPYGRNPVTRQRRCVFIGTINPDGTGYLKDTTGNRRYWPIKVTSIDIEGLRADRDQLWAEAREAYLTGEKYWIEADEEQAKRIAEEQEARREDDAWEAPIRKWLDEPEQRAAPFFASSDVLWKVLSVPLKDQDQRAKNRVAKILSICGFEGVNNKNGISGRSWQLKDD